MASDSEVLELLNKADWKTIQLRLMEYALFKIGRLRWRTAKNVLPKGYSPEDFVIQAIHKTFEGAASGEKKAGGYRRWDPETNPDLLNHLKSVIDSDVSHLVSSEEHKMTNYNAEEGDTEPVLVSNAADPEQEVLMREAEREQDMGFKQFLGFLMKDFESDLEVSAVLESYLRQSKGDGAVKPATVAKETGLDIALVRNAIKRLRRRVLSMGNQPGIQQFQEKGFRKDAAI